MTPVGPFYSNGVRLWAPEEYVRAWPGGAGACKLATNYGAAVLPLKLAQERGCDQVLWLYGPEHSITEIGTMNVFLFAVNKKGLFADAISCSISLSVHMSL